MIFVPDCPGRLEGDWHPRMLDPGLGELADGRRVDHRRIDLVTVLFAELLSWSCV